MLGHLSNKILPFSICCKLHTFPSLSQAAAATAKSSLGKLRKKTGYSLSTCKKALEETNHDIVKAEAWLQEQAQAQGWAKAQKLQGRNTHQGLLGVQILENKASLVELKCETDFVARNSKFLSLLQDISTSCLAVPRPSDVDGLLHTKISREELEAFQAAGGKTLADVVALNIGQLGENIMLGESSVFHSGDGVHLAGLTHPSASIHADQHKLQYGRYAAVMAYSGNGDESAVLARQVCQHIIGMAPTYVDNQEDKENSLVHQDFLLNEDVKMGNMLKSVGMEVHSFVRVELGQNTSQE